MNSSAQLADAIRETAAELRDGHDLTNRQEQTLRDGATLLRVLANVVDGMPLAKAFGAPGDWGYETGIGQGVRALHAAGARAAALPKDHLGMEVPQFETDAEEIAWLREMSGTAGVQPSEPPSPKELWARMDAIDPNWHYGDAYTGASIALRALTADGVQAAPPSDPWQRLCTAVNELMAYMGANGKAEARGDRAQAVMDAMAAVDAAGVKGGRDGR